MNFYQDNAKMAIPQAGSDTNLGYEQSFKSPEEPGVASAIKALMEEVHEAYTNSENLRSSLGISPPETGGAANSAAPSSLRAILMQLSGMLRNANANFSDVLRHLNS